jgi:sulfatase modifying factor 1
MRLAIIITVSIFLIVGMSIAQKGSPQTPNKPKEMPKEIIGKDGAKMVLIPAGEFLMGTDKAEISKLIQLAMDPEADASWFEDETPRHTVYVDAFYMDTYEVTNAQYKKFVQATKHGEPLGYKISFNSSNEVGMIGPYSPWSDPNFNKDNQPVVCVTWEDAKAYAEWAGKRLPTEAEWEYAARGGLAGKRYVWGDVWPPPKGSGNFADKSFKRAFPSRTIINGYDDSYAFTAPVGSFKPNGYGLYDMEGNVDELCADWYEDNYYASSPKSNPKGPSSGDFHVSRGGSWYFDVDRILRTADRRYRNAKVYSYYICGFRCAMSKAK